MGNIINYKLHLECFLDLLEVIKIAEDLKDQEILNLINRIKEVSLMV